jgi:hypothetical protein
MALPLGHGRLETRSQEPTVIHTDTDLEYWSRGYWLEIVGDEDEPEELIVCGGLLVAPRAERILVRTDREPAR